MDTLGITQRVYFNVKMATSIARASDNVISKNVKVVKEIHIWKLSRVPRIVVTLLYQATVPYFFSRCF